MKKLIFSLTVWVLTFNSNAQELSKTDAAAIEKRTKSFLKQVESNNYTGLTDYIYPKLFDHIPKKEMFQVFNLLEQAGIELEFNELKILNKKKLPTEKSIRYAMIRYKMDMILPLTTDDMKGIAVLLVPALQNSFGHENVIHNTEESYINIKGEKFLIGVLDPEYKEWMFIIYDDSFKKAIEKTLPSKIKQAIANNIKL